MCPCPRCSKTSTRTCALPSVPALRPPPPALRPCSAAHALLPAGLPEGEPYAPKQLEPTQHFTQPPPRYSEATLVKELEKNGIGRPSTYAQIISNIQDRGYVLLEQRRFHATELGEIVTDMLVGSFGDMINNDFTSGMEVKLDQVTVGAKRLGELRASARRAQE